MAYAALISLANTTHRILNYNLYSVSFEEEKQHIISLRDYVAPTAAFLEKFPDKFNSLEGRMREVTHEAEDILEYLELEKVSLSSSDDESPCDPSGVQELEVQLEKVMEKIYLIAAEVKVLEKVMEEIDLLAGEAENIKSSSQIEADSSAISSSSTAPPTHEGAVVGFEDYVEDMKDRLCREKSRLQVIPVCGMGGIGKTTLARKVYEDPLIREEFVIRVWVTISQDYSAQRIVTRILESLKEYNTGISGSNDGDKVWKILMLRRYLIVMDDIWSSEAWDALKRVFPDVRNGSCIVLTTRLSTVASYPDPCSKLCEMQLMDADQSWSLLKHKVFINNDYPELEDIGKEIARICKGLPLAIVVIAGLLSTVGKNPASWQEIANKVKSAAQEQIEDILSLSYRHLPQYLRPCFLYMGLFPEDEEINVSRLIRLWVAEGFVKRPNANRCESLEEEAGECLKDLVKRNLVLVRKRKHDGRIKSCSLHDVMRELSIREAHESKFLLSLMDENVEKGHFIERVKDERRVSVDASSLTFLSSIRSSAIHTTMCSRTHYISAKLKFVKSVRLLRVLDAECVGVESLPDQLFHLRYLAIGYISRTPVSLPNLQNLQTLIIDLNGSAVSNLRLQWCMPQLRHVYLYGGTIEFDDPKESDSCLENLETVSYMWHGSCTKRILKMIPSLKKLKIDCSYRRGDSAFLDDLVHLEQLQSLDIRAGPWILKLWPEFSKSSFHAKLKRLCLVDLEFPWEDMIFGGSLPHLQLLKLRGCTCVGSTWKTMDRQFPQLEFLVIEDAFSFENWITESSHFPRLKRLVLDYCSDLSRIPNDIGEITTLEVIEIKGDVKKSLVESAGEIQKEQEDLGNSTLQVLCTKHSDEKMEYDEGEDEEQESASDDADADEDDEDEDEEHESVSEDEDGDEESEEVKWTASKKES